MAITAAPYRDRPKSAYVREDRILPHLSALYLLLTELCGGRRRRRTRRGIDVRPQATPQDVTGYLRDQQITLRYDSESSVPDG